MPTIEVEYKCSECGDLVEEIEEGQIYECGNCCLTFERVTAIKWEVTGY